MSRRHALPIAGGMLLIGASGYLLGVASTAPAGPAAPSGPVSVSVVHEESGELRSVELTDAEGHDVEVGSVAEEFPYLERDYAAERDDGDQSTDSDG